MRSPIYLVDKSHKKKRENSKLTTLPKDNRFYTSDYKSKNYSLLLSDKKKAPPNTSYPVFAHIPGQKKKILNITDEDFSINDASDDIEQTCSAIYNIADSFRYGRQINQIRKMSSEYLSTESLNDHTYEEIPEEVQAVDECLNDEDWLELQKGNVDISLIQELEQAKEKYKQCTHKYDIVEPTTLHTEVVKVSCKHLLLKLTEFTKQAQLDTDTILREQINDPVLQAVRQWLKAGKEPSKTSTIKRCKGLPAYKNMFNLRIPEEQYVLLCYNKPNENDTKKCVPLSLYLKCFELAHNNPLSEHRGDTCTLNNISRFFYWPGMYKWITMLVHDSLDCQKNKPQRQDLNEAPLE